MSQNNQIIQQVIDKATESAQQKGCGPFAAAVVRNGEIIALGHNQVVANCDPTAHAEVIAIRKACQSLVTHDLSECELYASCEPCPMCLSAIAWARITKVYYAATRDDAAAAGFDDAAIYNEFTSEQAVMVSRKQMACATMQQPFIAWQQNRSKVPY